MNDDLGAVAPFSSEGLAFDGGPKPDVSAAGVGLATSDPGRDEDGAPRYGTLSGSSASAAVTAGAAALLAQARPELDAAALKAALVASAHRAGGLAAGLVDPAAAAAVELVAEPSLVGLGSARAEGATVTRRVTLRNLSRRALEITIQPGTADAADIAVETTPSVARLKPGASLRIKVAATVPLLPRAPGTLGGALRVKIRGGATPPGAMADRRPARPPGPDPEREALEPCARPVGRRSDGADGRRRTGRRQRRAPPAAAARGADDRALPG